jgi:hypothetical protein
MPTTIAHPTFNSWWQEFHDHIFSEPVHVFCAALMPDFLPTSEVIWCTFGSDMSSLFMILTFIFLSTEHGACPSSQGYCLQCWRPNLSTGIQIHNSGSTDVQVRYNRSQPI